MHDDDRSAVVYGRNTCVLICKGRVVKARGIFQLFFTSGSPRENGKHSALDAYAERFERASAKEIF